MVPGDIPFTGGYDCPRPLDCSPHPFITRRGRRPRHGASANVKTKPTLAQNIEDAAWDGFRGREGWEPRRPVSRILYPDGIGTVVIYLAPALPPGSCGQPGGAAGHRRPERSGHAPLFGLAPGGVYQRPVSPQDLVRSYRTVSPLPVPRTCRGHRRTGLCGTRRRLAAPGRYPAPCPAESGLSSPQENGATTRPPWLPPHSTTRACA